MGVLMVFTKEILDEYRLSKTEWRELKSKIVGVLKDINIYIRKNKVKADVVVGGSAAKGVLLKGDFDVDLFVRFDPKYKNEDISEILGKILKPFKPARLQGSRDYFQFPKEGIHYEVVPVLRIKKWREAVNVTDASPLHVVWVNSKVRKNPRLIDEIILAKVFLKANRLYGAESYIGGFSGHVVDILVINYGSFLNFLRGAVKWKPFVVVDVERHYKGREPDLNQSKIGPLILIDPVQPQRNAAAAVNLETFNRLIEVAKRFLKSPNQKYFVRAELGESKLKAIAGPDKLITLELGLKRGKLDVNGARIVKTLEFLATKLKENDFKVINKGWEWDKGSKAIVWLVVDRKPLEKVKMHAGPPINLKEHAAAFKKIYKKSFVKDGKLFAEIKRKYTEPEKLAGVLLKDEYIAGRFRQIRLKA